MIFRKATEADLDAVEAGYTELLTHEREHGAWTAWKLGVYPTRATARTALEAGELYVLELEDGSLPVSVILGRTQPEEYASIPWQIPADGDRALVVHTLCVRPSASGRGLGKETVRQILAEARRQGCAAVRLDTGSQNKPAVGLYTGQGFTLAGTGSVKLGGQIPHAGQVFLEHAV